MSNIEQVENDHEEENTYKVFRKLEELLEECHFMIGRDEDDKMEAKGYADEMAAMVIENIEKLLTALNARLGLNKGD